MTRPWTLLLGIVALLTACDGAALRSKDGALRVVARVDADAPAAASAAAAALRAAGDGAVLVSLSATGSDAWLAARAANGDTHAFLHVGTVDGAIAPTGRDVVVAEDTGAQAAVEMALLHAHGIELPTQLPLGSHTRTAANAAAGGTARLGPGQLVLQLLRNQHAALLTSKPTTDVVFRIGFVGQRALRDRPMRDQVAAAAQRFPQLVLRDAFADGGELARVETLARELVADGCRALLLRVDDPTQLAATRAIADAQKVALLVLDPLLRGEHATCVLGAEQTLLGRATGEALRQQLPNGGALVLLHGDLREPGQRQRFDGFVAALQLESH